MSGNWVLKVYIKENTPKRISKMVQKKNTKYKKNCCVNNYIDKPKKIIKKLKLAGVRYECYRVEYERASNYRQVFFSRTSGPYRCRYCNKRLSKKNVLVDHIIPVAKTQKNAIARILLSMKGCSSVNDIKNLAPACRNCNLKKSDKMGMWIFRGWLGRYRTYWVVLNIIKALSVLLMILGILYIFGVLTKF